jgi:hypothetical protein
MVLAKGFSVREGRFSPTRSTQCKGNALNNNKINNQKISYYNVYKE